MTWIYYNCSYPFKSLDKASQDMNVVHSSAKPASQDLNVVHSSAKPRALRKKDQ